MNRQQKIVRQQCNECGCEFDLVYWSDGTYTYLDDTCDCESNFSPVDGQPSLSEWLEQIKKAG